MSDEAGEKKHDPGEKKWRDAAEKGQLPRSGDVGAVAVICAGAAALVAGMGPGVGAIRELATSLFHAEGPYTFTSADASSLADQAMLAVLQGVAAPLGAVLLAGLVANLAQTNMTLATQALEPKWDKLNVVTGVQNAYFSATPFVELGKGIAKIGVIALVVVMAMRQRLSELPKLATQPPAAALAELVEIGGTMVVLALPVMLAIAAADYGYAVYRTTEQLKRTDKELRDDHKEAEGDPMLKAKRRQRALQIARTVNIALVAQADVVVTNPTHYAVALRYKRDQDMAPVVLAMGVDHLAQQIKRRARQEGVPQVENRALARALYAKAESGQAIPEELYKPVAKVLATVMARRKKR
jgi:flagellar biosynthesis protein FlhB